MSDATEPDRPTFESSTSDPARGGLFAAARRRALPGRGMAAAVAALAVAAVVIGGIVLRRSSTPVAVRTTVAQQPLAALVDGVPVTMAAFERQLRFVTNAYAGPRALPGSPTDRTIHRLLVDRAVGMAIAEALIDSRAVGHGLTVPDAEVSAEVARMETAAGGAAALAAQMRATGMSTDEVRQVARHALLRDRLGAELKDPAWLDHLVSRSTIIYYVGDGAAAPQDVPGISLGHPAPPVVAADLKGRAVSLADLQGRPVVLTFWSTSCGYCQDQLSMLLGFARRRPDVAVVALDHQEDPLVVRRFIQLHHLRGLSVWLDTAGQAYIDYTLSGLPATFFIDRAGRVRGYNFGPLANQSALTSGAKFAVRGLDYTTYNQAH